MSRVELSKLSRVPEERTRQGLSPTYSLRHSLEIELESLISLSEQQYHDQRDWSFLPSQQEQIPVE